MNCGSHFRREELEHDKAYKKFGILRAGAFLKQLYKSLILGSLGKALRKLY